MTVIEALAKEAGWDSARPPYGKFSQYDEFDHVQFAKLIVQECANICFEQSEISSNDDHKNQAKIDGHLIKKHFGVE